MPFHFRFRLLPFIAMLVVVAVGISLGQWQVRRAHEKEAIERKIGERAAAPPLRMDDAELQRADVDALEFRQVALKGEFQPGWTIYLDNRPHEGRAGFYVLTPLKIAGSGRHIMVARGWLPRDLADRSRIPRIATPVGAIELTGIVRQHAGRLLQLGQAATIKPGAIVQNLDVADMAKASGLELAPFIVEQTSDAGDGLVRAWPKPSQGVDKHWGYAFQWFALAGTALIFFVVTGFKRGSK
jgi:cytochrome oxidase assembly protein ShyY1